MNRSHVLLTQVYRAVITQPGWITGEDGSDKPLVLPDNLVIGCSTTTEWELPKIKIILTIWATMVLIFNNFFIIIPIIYAGLGPVFLLWLLS